jgi:hypothetical protein
LTGRQSHDSLVKGLIDFFTQNDIQIYLANYPGYEKSIVINRHSPDVIAIDQKTGLGYIGEAKLCSELGDQLTKEQFEDFPKRIINDGKSAGKLMPFYIIVPEECQFKIKETYRQFEIPWKENIHVICI